MKKRTSGSLQDFVQLLIPPSQMASMHCGSLCPGSTELTWYGSFYVTGFSLFTGVVKLLAEINNNGNVVDGAGEECTVREQDRFMPIANVIRIMRKILPQHAKISDDAKETIQECVSEYISFITSEANERCQREQRKTITAEDVLFAMSKLGFDDYIEPLTVYLHRYRELEGDRAGAGSASSSIGLKRSGSGNGGSNGGGFMVEYLGGSSSGFGTAPFHPHHHVAPPPPHSRHPVHNGFYGGANVSPRGNGAASNGGHPVFGHHRHHHDQK